MNSNCPANGRSWSPPVTNPRSNSLTLTESNCRTRTVTWPSKASARPLTRNRKEITCCLAGMSTWIVAVVVPANDQPPPRRTDTTVAWPRHRLAAG